MLTTIKIIVLLKLRLKRPYLTDHHGNKQVNFLKCLDPVLLVVCKFFLQPCHSFKMKISCLRSLQDWHLSGA